ncbi:Rne/Rng family ribonuclease [Streptomyces niveus]|uniref:Rne/Rng family ribonuclease n=1 Tax=Streptomyces niveus TaxID=193462 RepID=UPI0036DF3F27
MSQNEPGTNRETEEELNSPSDTLPPRRRRRAASRPAGPPSAAAETADGAKVTASVPEETSEPAAAVDEAAPPKARRRATRKATAPVEIVADPAPEAAAPETLAEPAADEAAPPRARRRATRKVTAPATSTAQADEDTETPTQGETLPANTVTQITADEAQVEAAEKAATRGRSRRRGGGSPEPTPEAEERTAPEPKARKAEQRNGSAPAAAKDKETEAPERSRRRATRPAVAVFQAPVFAEPMFQTPESAAAMAAAGGVEDEDDLDIEDETTAEPVAAPAPELAGRRRRRRRGEPAEAAEPAQAPAARDADEEPETEQSAEGDESDADAEDSDEFDRPSRRRRRGGRRRRRGESAESDEQSDEHADDASDERSQDRGRKHAADTDDEDGSDTDAADSDEQDDDEAAGQSGGGSSSSRRRRRRRRRSGDGGSDTENNGVDDPERTVVKVREPRERRAKDTEPGTGVDEVQSIKGSTRLEAKKQRRREGREQGRRRVPIITEAEFLARREAVERVMVVRQSGERTQIGVLEDNVLVEHYVNKEQATSYVGNVYLGKVQNVLPSMEAAFVDIGKGRNAVLYAGEVNFEALGMSGGPRRIETALKSGQSVLVQVTKDPIGHKGARLTSQVSLPGRYLVYVPEGSMTGISRKLPDTERARLKTILKKIVPEDAGVIVRTAAEGASEDELRRDVERLQSQWEDIKKKAKSGNAPTLLYGEPDMTVRVVRDIFNEDFTKVIVSGDEAWQTIHGYVAHVAPDLSDRLNRWTSEVDVFASYRIDEQLMKALDRKVWLPSGGSLVIDKTEAMIVVDVNTGKFTGQGGNLEETVTRNNLEAAEEIVRQLRLRDLGGIVVIDFIDMVLESNRDLVLRRLLECLGRDRTKHQVAEVTSLGLVQMTRKRVGQGLLESFSETCVHCNGRGVIVHMEQPTSSGGGGGNAGGTGKRAKKRRGGSGADHEHETAADVLTDAEAQSESESEAEVAAEAAAPVALPAPEFVPDEELYSSVAEAETAARGGRSRRRASRKASAPAGSPRSAEPVAEPAQAPAPVASSAPVTEPDAEVAEAAPQGRTRRRATRKASAPAGSPKTGGAEETAEVVVEQQSEAEPVQPEPVADTPVADTPVAETSEAAPPRARRRATRKASAPAGSPAGAGEAAVLVVDSAESAQSAESAGHAGDSTESGESAKSAESGDDGNAESSAPAKKAARKTAKKATAKKAATKKTAAKKTTAKKATAKKTTTKSAAKKTSAAEQQTAPAVSVSTDG